jgi:hypothetical protein
MTAIAFTDNDTTRRAVVRVCGFSVKCKWIWYILYISKPVHFDALVILTWPIHLPALLTVWSLHCVSLRCAIRVSRLWIDFF